MPSRATPQPAETQSAAEPLPLFRPDVLRRQERFFGEAVRIRPFSFAFLAWLVFGLATLTGGVLFFGTYTETAPVRGFMLPPARKPSQFTSPGKQRLFQLFEPSQGRGRSQP